MMTLPKTTPTGVPCSALGTSKSSRVADLGAGGFGAKAHETYADTNMITIWIKKFMSVYRRSFERVLRWHMSETPVI